ncbi:MAG: ATP phosphoribosyltransferase regulatory subunit [Alphaproteobacteria bacterium]
MPQTPDLKDILTAGGATWLDLPVLHPADPFLETAGEDIRRRMFVTEGPTGARLALRPDFTIPACLHHIAMGSGPARYAYEGIVFRRHEAGDMSERREAGYEDIGDPDRAAADARTLQLALAALAALGESDLVIRIGDISLFAALTAALGLPEPWQRRLRRSYGNDAAMAESLARLAANDGATSGPADPEIEALARDHDRDGLVTCLAGRLTKAGFSLGTGRTAADIATRYLDRQALAEARVDASEIKVLEEFLALDSRLEQTPDTLRDLASANNLDLAMAIDTFAARAKALKAAAGGVSIRFDGSFGRPLDYYTGLVFEIARNSDDTILAGGGRYDRLLDMLGAPEPVPAVGLSLRLDRIAANPIDAGKGGRS